MTDSLERAAEEWYGIKANHDDAQKLRAFLLEAYGGETPETIKKVFASGAAASFLTVNETYFFREPAHFFLLNDLLPSYEKTGIRICSAATATGCEAYSMAMLIEAYNRNSANPVMYHIDAFDINPKAIEAARKGLYSARAMREDGSAFHYLANPYIEKDSGQPHEAASCQVSKRLQICGSLQTNISFFTHNVMNSLPSSGYDIIFFRNALIYFAIQKRERVLSNLSLALKDGGILILGVSETAGAHHADLDEKNTSDVFYFQKRPS